MRADRLESWHSYREIAVAVVVILFALMPWRLTPAAGIDDLARIGSILAGAVALPLWRAGVVVDGRGVRFDYGVGARRFEWDEIAVASVARRNLEPRLLVTLTDGRDFWAPGFTVPASQRSSRQDGWRGTELFRAAELITTEAERRRHASPRDGHTRLARPAFRRSVAA